MERILVATDLTERSDRAVERGIRLAKSFGAELTILHVVDEDLPSSVADKHKDAAEGATTIDVFDRRRIRNVVRFGEFSAGDIMIPANDMTAVSSIHSTADVLTMVRRAGTTHLPVYEGTRSNIIGLVTLTVWDLIKPGFANQELQTLFKPAFFVLQQQPVSELLPLLRARDDQCAIVVDEYGSSVGMITVEQLLEAIVGSVDVGGGVVERPIARRPRIEALEDEIYIIDARLPIAELNEELGTYIAVGDAHTIGGLVLRRLRHVPKAGETISEGGYTFTVLEASDRAVNKIRAERI